MNGTGPAVSVIIPAYNAEKHIADTIRSVLDQTFRDFEMVIVDDGSTDNTARIVETFLADHRIRLIRQPNGGASRARNTGLQNARGTYIAFLDADDLWLPEKLHKQVTYLGEHPHIGAVISDFAIFEGHSLTVPSYLRTKEHYADIMAQRDHLKDAFAFLLEEMFMIPSTMVLKRECVERIGLFDETLIPVEDRDFALRLAMRYAIACLPEVLVRKIEHGSNVSLNYQKAAVSRYRVYRKLYRREYPLLEPYRDIFRSVFSARALSAGRVHLGRLERNEARECLSLSLRMKHGARAAFLFFLTFLPGPLLARGPDIKENLKSS